MNKLKLTLMVLFAGLCAVFINSAIAENADVDVHIFPEEAEVSVGGSIKFDAFAFSINSAGNAPAKIDQITWEVVPDSMGTITADGFFVAGRNVGIVKIKVIVQIGTRRLVKVITIRIGKLPKPFLDAKIVPRAAVVPMGTEKQFEVVVTTRDGKHVRPKNVHWEVKPEDLGKIDEHGLFVAGDQEGRGKVVAVIEVDNLRLHAAADVIVSAPGTGEIAGKISNDADDGPVPGAVIKAIRLGRIPWIQRTESDDAGDYRLGDLIPGHYIVYANAKDFIGEFYKDARDYLQAFVLKVAEEDTLTDIDFGLSEGAVISGIVTDETGAALKGAHVLAFLKLNPRFARHARTDETGLYEIGELPSGAYLAVADAPGYQAEFFDNQQHLRDADVINVQEPDKKDGIDFDLPMGSAITGIVRDSDGNPIAGAHVRAFLQLSSAAHPHRALREARTNENGEYVLQVRPGHYLVSASAEGFNTQFFDHARDRQSATSVPVTAGAHTANVDFDLTKRGSIAGKVTDQTTGNPIAGAIVEAFKERSTIDHAASIAGFRAKTDDNGDYLIENVPSGHYIVVAAAEGYLPEFWEEVPTKDRATQVEVTDGEAEAAINFTLELGGSISGTVASAVDTIPVPRALVKVWEVESHHHLRGYTNDNGEYKVSGLPTGKYFVQVIAKGFFAQFYKEARGRDEAEQVPVEAPGEASGIDFFLHPKKDREGTMVGRVFSDADESPILGAVVVAVSPRHRVPFITFTGPHGFYKLTGLPSGRYFVFAWARGFVGEFFEDAKRFKDAVPVGVESGHLTAEINFGLTPRHRRGAYAISGRIRAQATNAVLQGILMRARSTDGSVEATAVTDANGNYMIVDLPSGDYKVDASGVGYQDGYFGGTNEQNSATLSVGNGQDAQANMNLGIDAVTSIGSENGNLPENFELLQNYPNPFNPNTQIKYKVSESSEVTLKIFNLLGQEVITLVNKEQQPGAYTVQWDGKDNFGRPVASGVYVFQMKAGNKFSVAKRMLLLK